MTCIKKLSIFLALTAFLCPSAHSDTPVLSDKSKVLASAALATAKAYPDSDSIILDDYEKVIYKKNGTYKTWEELYEKILTEKGKRENKTLSFHFTLPYSTAKVLLLEIIKPDGRAVKVDVPKNSRVMVDRSQMGSNIYNPNNKALKLTIPELEIGDIIHYVFFKDNVKTRVPDSWSGYNVFEYTNPIIHAELEITAPAELPLINIKLRDHTKDSVSFSKKEKDGRIIYKWNVKNVPRIFKEPGMPPYWTVVQRVISSTIPNWQYVSKWYWQLCKPRLEKTTPEMKAKVAELTSGITDRNKQIDAIFRFVSQKIRYMGITTEKTAPGYEPHDVNITFENKYGVCRDKAALLVAMLRLGGFKAFPVLINNGPKKDPEVPQPYFNHAITCVENSDGSYILMDSTDESSKELFPSYLCDQSYLVAKPEGDILRTSPIIPARENLLAINTKATLSETGKLSASSSLLFQGVNDGIYRGAFSRWKPERRKSFFEGGLKRAVSGAKLTSFKIIPKNLRDTSIPLKVELEYSADNFMVEGKKDTVLSLPWLGTSFGVVNFVLGKAGLKKRKYPLDTDIACGVDETLTLDLGKAVGKTVAMPNYKKIDSDTILWKRSASREGKILTGKNEFLLKVVEFTPKQYLALKASLKNIEYQARKLPIFASVKQAASQADAKYADILIEEENVRIEIIDKNSCEISKTVRKKILNYAGKKKNSEIKINYNPAWEKVSVTAKVITAEGKVKTLGKEELNLMDAAWSGSAPRYPAEKTLVASLPGVDVGSVMEYTIKRTLSKRPFISLAGYFRYSDPLLAKTVTIIAPESLKASTLQPDTLYSFSRKKLSGKRVEYSWAASNQPGVKDESSMAPWWVFNPALFMSTGTWSEYAKLLNKTLKQAALDNSESFKKAKELTKDKQNAREKIIAIRDFVAMGIRLAGPGLNSLPLDCASKADATLADGYGNSVDRAILLFAMLKSVGFAPEFVLASSYPDLRSVLEKPQECPQRFLYSQILLRAKLDGKDIYLNDTNQYAQLGASSFADKPAIFLDSGTFGAIGIEKELKDCKEVSYDIIIDEQGNAMVERAEKYFGMDFEGFHKMFAEITPEKRNRYFQERVASVSQSAQAKGKLETMFDSYPGIERFSVSIDKFAVKDGNFLYLQLPGFFLKNIMPLRSDVRVNPFYSGERTSIVLKYKLKLPVKYKNIKLAPESFDWSSPKNGGKLSFKSEITDSDSGKIIMISCAANLSPAVFGVEDYQSLLCLNRKLSHPKLKIILASDE